MIDRSAMNQRIDHIHLNPVGGIAGDMFAAAVIDLVPHLEDAVVKAMQQVKILKTVQVCAPACPGAQLKGRKFIVAQPADDHCHAGYTELRDALASSALPAKVQAKAQCILRLLAAAEAAVHGGELETVVLHEAGSLDSLADIVAAAVIIAELGKLRWSSDCLPRGRGLVATAHGQLPLPAPAAAELLSGYPTFDDGRIGERVTPTGAAILRVLDPSFEVQAAPMELLRTGTGFGDHAFDGIPNMLRVTAYRHVHQSSREKIAVISFEVDDQTPEDLSIGLDRLRHTAGVLDVMQIAAVGKKGRMAIQLQVLAESEAAEKVLKLCLCETSTLGVRCHMVDRYAVDRTELTYDSAGGAVPVKLAYRPDGAKTAKAESSALANAGDYAQRKILKQRTEQDAENR